MSDVKKDFTVSSIQPNLRFGTSFLDTKYREYAADGEALMDKRTGEVILKRKSDGSLIYFDREHAQFIDSITEIQSVIKSNPSLILPNIKKCPNIEGTYFMSSLIDLQDFRPAPDNYDETYSSGKSFVNNSDSPSFSFSHDSNGILVKPMTRPRDSALIEYCSSLYNNMYKNYAGDDEDSLAQKELLKDKSFELSNIQVQYTVRLFNTSGTEFLTYNKSANLRVNEYGVLPFYDVDNSRISCMYCTVEIDSVSIPKMEYVKDDIFTDEIKLTMYKELADNDGNLIINPENDIEITHMFVSSFFESGETAKFPDSTNTRILNCIPLTAYEDMISNLKHMSYELGISVSEQEPDDVTLNGLNVWVEKFRHVYAKGETVDVENPVTSFDELEVLFGEVEMITGDMTTDSSLINDFFVGLQNSNGQFTEPYVNTQYSQNHLPW